LKYWHEPLPVPTSDWGANTNRQAETDGFLSAWIALAGDGHSTEVRAYTDSTPYPQSRRSIASIDWRGENRMRDANVFTPVRAGDHARVEVVARVGTPAVSILFQPFPLALGAWSLLKFNTPYPKRDQDGFVVASIWGGNGDRGLIFGRQKIGQELARCAAASMHLYSDFQNGVQSFCMAVPKGSDFQIDFTPTNGNPSCAVSWIPMGASNRMQPLSRPQVNQISKAETNGILTGYVETPGGVASLKIEVSETQDFKNPVILSRTTVQHRHDRYVPNNSATAVVRKGTWFRASLAWDDGSDQANAGLTWVGIEPA
jgi:hypothetical protein